MKASEARKLTEVLNKEGVPLPYEEVIKKIRARATEGYRHLYIITAMTESSFAEGCLSKECIQRLQKDGYEVDSLSAHIRIKW